MGYNAANGLILLPVGLENKSENKTVVYTDAWIYLKRD